MLWGSVVTEMMKGNTRFVNQLLLQLVVQKKIQWSGRFYFTDKLNVYKQANSWTNFFPLKQNVVIVM